jgi:hypothetical protein
MASPQRVGSVHDSETLFLFDRFPRSGNLPNHKERTRHHRFGEITMNPSLYQINTRVMLTGLFITLKRSATLDDIPDRELDELARDGFDWVWFLEVGQTGPASRTKRTSSGPNSSSSPAC